MIQRYELKKELVGALYQDEQGLIVYYADARADKLATLRRVREKVATKKVDVVQYFDGLSMADRIRGDLIKDILSIIDEEIKEVES
jgi:hypothetical protein